MIVVTGRSAAGPVALGLAGAGVAAQIAYPLTSGPTRDVVTISVVLLLAAACVAHGVASRGARWATGLLLITAGGGIVAELAGTATGFPFGGYTYADGGLGPQLAGVPLLIGPAWTLGAYPAWCAARVVLGAGRPLARVALAAWGLAAWDLYLDPQMVADGRWSWAEPSPALPGLPGIPISNYVGWLVVAVLMAAGLQLLERTATAPRTPSDRLPVALYCWTWLGSGLAHAVFLGLPVSAAYGLLGMGVLGLPLVRRLATHPPTRLVALVSRALPVR